MGRFVPLRQQELLEVLAAAGVEPRAASRIAPEYYAQVLPVRLVFWQRLWIVQRLLARHAPSARSCLDFGGGGGLLSPTLAASFAEVTLLDLDVREARVVKERRGLANLELVQADATACDLGAERFDAVVAADVLEHFREVEAALTPIHRWLRPGGILVTSLPTETRTYELLRKVFRTEKPADHYHTAEEVEARIQRHGFTRLTRRHAPLPLGVLPLFYVSAWRKG